MGLDDVTCRALRETYEQWDGKGGPRKLMGEEVSLPARIVQLADLTEVTYRRAALTPPASTRASDAGGISTHAGRPVHHRGRGTRGRHRCRLQLLGGRDRRRAVADALRGRRRSRCRARGDGGSRRHEVAVDVGALARCGQPCAGGGPDTRPCGQRTVCVAPRRIPPRPGPARHLQRDLGQTGPLTPAELEHTWLHPYLTSRMLAGVPACRRWPAAASWRQIITSGSTARAIPAASTRRS
ncbi:MAG: hypothetical protein ACXVXD_01415 [Nocardioidaceae bacterium]